MYAIFQSGGRQYWAETDDVIRIDKLETEAGEQVEFDKVLAVRDDEAITIGQPYVEGARIVAKVLSHGRDKKIRVFTYKRKKHEKRTKGHRQDYTAVKIESISV